MHDVHEATALSGALPIPAHDGLPVDEVAADLRDHLARIRESGRAIVLTDNGGAQAVLLDVGVYAKLLDALEEADDLAGIYRGLLDVERGKVKPVDEAFDAVAERVKNRGATAE